MSSANGVKRHRSHVRSHSTHHREMLRAGHAAQTFQLYRVRLRRCVGRVGSWNHRRMLPNSARKGFLASRDTARIPIRPVNPEVGRHPLQIRPQRKNVDEALDSSIPHPLGIAGITRIFCAGFFIRGSALPSVGRYRIRPKNFSISRLSGFGPNLIASRQATADPTRSHRNGFNPNNS